MSLVLLFQTMLGGISASASFCPKFTRLRSLTVCPHVPGTGRGAGEALVQGEVATVLASLSEPCIRAVSTPKFPLI